MWQYITRRTQIKVKIKRTSSMANRVYAPKVCRNLKFGPINQLLLRLLAVAAESNCYLANSPNYPTIGLYAENK